MIESLNQKLYNQVDTAWQETPTFSDNLVYQVKVQENGEIADYSPLNEAAVQHLSEIPLDNLQDKKAGELSAKVAKFLVVLTPSGSLQVNPWIGQ
jgi:ribosomal protein L10